jgi:hypothetical protein
MYDTLVRQTGPRGKVFCMHAMKAYGKCRLSPFILNLATMEVSGQLHKPAAVLLGKRTSLSTEQEAVWAPDSVWTLQRKGKCFNTIQYNIINTV